jgi:hypothetical protein
MLGQPARRRQHSVFPERTRFQVTGLCHRLPLTSDVTDEKSRRLVLMRARLTLEFNTTNPRLRQGRPSTFSLPPLQSALPSLQLLQPLIFHTDLWNFQGPSPMACHEASSHSTNSMAVGRGFGHHPSLESPCFSGYPKCV